MTWVGRGARALALSLLAVLWGAAAHGRGLPDPGSLVPLLWASMATALLGWTALAPRRPDRGPTARGLAVAAVAGAGQALTHAALAVSPLLTARTARHVEAHGHREVVVSGSPDPQAVLAALTHGGTPMLTVHALATLVVALLWASAGLLWRSACAWWDRLVTTVGSSTRTASGPLAGHVPAVIRTTAAHLSWDGRAPPAPALP